LENEEVVEQSTVVTDDPNPVSNTPEVTAAEGDVEKKEQVEKVFTQAEVDALIQRRLVKEARRQARHAEQMAQERVVAAEPKREQFQDDEVYSDAKVRHLAETKAREIVEQRTRAEQNDRLREQYDERTEKARERYADFTAVVENPLLSVNEAMAEFIMDSEHGPDVAYYLGKNPAKADQIAQLSPMRAARELSRIEAEIAARPKASPSKAPEPITPVGTRGKSAASPLPSDDDDIDTWMRKERERVARRG
jgi:hypothetical protein